MTQDRKQDIFDKDWWTDDEIHNDDVYDDDQIHNDDDGDDDGDDNDNDYIEQRVTLVLKEMSVKMCLCSW